MKRLITLFSLLFSLTAINAVAQTSIYSQNFDSLTVGQPVSGWQNTGSCSWVVETNSPVTSPNAFGPSTSAGGVGCGYAAYTASPVLADSQLYFDTTAMLNSSGMGYQPAAIFRSDGVNNAVLLQAQWIASGTSSTSIRVTPYKQVSGVYTAGTAVTTTVSSVSNGAQMSFAFQLQGSTWSMSVWPYGTSQPGSWTATGSIPSGSAASGYDGIFPTFGTAGQPLTGFVTADDVQLFALSGISPSPSNINATSTGNVITLTGYGTSWSSTTFSLSGGSGASITAQSVSSSTSASITVTAGSATGALTISDSTDAYTATITVLPAPVEIPVTNALWFFSPFNTWSDGTSGLQSNNVQTGSTKTAWTTPGAYTKFNVTSTANITLDVTTSALSGCGSASNGCPQIKYSVDGGAFTSYIITGSESTISLLSGATVKSHTVLLYEINTPQGARWGSGSVPNDAFVINGVTVDGVPATLSTLTGSLAIQPYNCVFFGDSITEGRFTESANNSAITYPQAGDAQHDYVFNIGNMMNCEYGQIGYSGQGWSVAGSSGSPAFPSSWNLYFASNSRLVSGLFSPMPNYVFLNVGTNDGSTNIVSTVTTTLQSIRAALNTAIPIIVITPFNQTQAGNIASGIVATSDPFIYSVNLGTPGTYGIQSASTGATLFSYDGLHPNAYNHGRLATLLAQALQRMFPVNGQTVVTVGQ